MYKIYNPYLLASIATIGGLLFGFDISSVSSFVDDEAYLEFFNHPSSIEQGGITASMAGGSFLTSLVCGFFVDKFGRRPVIQIASCFWIIGCAIQCSSRNVAQLICGRVIAGFGIGFASSTVPVYISELAPKKIRGRLGGLFQWAVTWGIMIMFYIGYGCTFIEGNASFRTAWGIMMIPGAILFCGTFFLAESPRWLAKNGQWEEAIHIISMIQSKGDVNHPDVALEIEEIREAIEQDKEASKTTIADLFRKDSIVRTSVGISAQIWQQLTGMNVMMYYIVYMFKMAGYEGNTALVSSSIQYVINVVMTVPALLFIDSWGRRRVLISGSLLMAMWLLIMVVLLGIYSIPLENIPDSEMIRITVENKKASKAIISVSYLFVASFAPTWGPGIWLYCSEIFPNRQRGLASGISASANWIFNFALAMFVPTAFKNITWRTYIIFLVFCVVMTFHVYFMFPETKGKTLEEIEMMWDSKIPAWKSSSWTPDNTPVARQIGLDEKHKDVPEGEHAEDVKSDIAPQV
ncbi:hypothetical protein D0Z03_002911 [Geotrichum reessii]|nr:hypothetical protein D0Z03_002911 [Galactomyces reessii]